MSDLYYSPRETGRARRRGRQRRRGRGTSTTAGIPPNVRSVSLPPDEEKRRGLWETITPWITATGSVIPNVVEDIARVIATGDTEEWRDPIRRSAPWNPEFRQGTWKNILFGGESSAEEARTKSKAWEDRDIRGLIPIDPSKKGGRNIIREVGGFIGDVATDPLTYVSFGGTAAAKAGATQFARMATAQALRRLDDPRVAQRVFGKKMQKAMASRRGLGGDTVESKIVSQYQDRVWKDAYREALTTPQETLRRRYVSELREEKARLQDYIDHPVGSTKATRMNNKAKSEAAMIKVNDDLQYAIDPEKWATDFHALGQTSWRFGGHQIKSTIKDTPGVIRRNIAEVGAAVRQAARANPVTGRFLDAWWSATNTGVIGRIRQQLGFYNGIGKVLNAERVANQKGVMATSRETTDQIERIFQGATDEDKQGLVNLYSAIYDYKTNRMKQARQAGEIKTEEQAKAFFNNPLLEGEALQDAAVRASVPAESLERVLTGPDSIYSQVREMTSRWLDIEKGYAREGIIDDFNDISNYLPINYRRALSPVDTGAKVIGAPTYAPHMVRAQTREQAVKSEAEKLGIYFGMNDDAARAMVEMDKSRLIGDPQVMLRLRGETHARIQGRAKMLQSLRPFGININEMQHMARMSRTIPNAPESLFRESEQMGKLLKASYDRGGGDLGLWRLDDRAPFLQGWMFPREQYEVFSRALDIVNDQHNVIYNMFRRYSRFWSNMVTLSPRYHIRNIISNYALIMLRHGVDAVNPRDWLAAVAGASYKLETPASKLTQRVAKISGRLPEKTSLGMEIGDHTIKELADEAYKHGVISKVSYATGGLTGATAQDVLQDQLPRTVIGKGVKAATQTSQNVGSVIESSQRFNMFLLNVKKMIQPGKHTRLTDAEIQWAAMDANRWMVDYANLTQFERRYLRYIFPFYSWIRHNIPNMLEGLVENPGLFAMAIRGEKAIVQTLGDADVDIDRDIIPDWMLEMNYLPFQENEDGTITMANLGLPWNELNILPVSFPEQRGLFGLPKPEPKQLVNEIVQRSNPILKSIGVIWAETDPLTDRDLSDLIEVPPGLHALRKLSPETLQFIDGAASLFGMEEGLGFTDEWGNPNYDRKGRLQMDGTAAQLIKDNLPVIQTINNLFNFGISGLDRLGIVSWETLKDADLADPSKDSMERWLKAMGWGFGLAQKKINPYDEMYWRQRDREQRKRQRRNYYYNFQ